MPSHFPKGVPLFFPNITCSILRASLPPHQALFKFPLHLNKIDIARYLTALYNVTVLDVKTAIIQGKTIPNGRGQNVKAGDWKRALVTTKEDFEWPPPPPEEGTFKIPKNSVPWGKGSHKRKDAD